MLQREQRLLRRISVRGDCAGRRNGAVVFFKRLVLVVPVVRPIHRGQAPAVRAVPFKVLGIRQRISLAHQRFIAVVAKIVAVLVTHPARIVTHVTVLRKEERAG